MHPHIIREGKKKGTKPTRAVFAFRFRSCVQKKKERKRSRPSSPNCARRKKKKEGPSPCPTLPRGLVKRKKKKKLIGVLPKEREEIQKKAPVLGVQEGKEKKGEKKRFDVVHLDVIREKRKNVNLGSPFGLVKEKKKKGTANCLGTAREEEKEKKRWGKTNRRSTSWRHPLRNKKKEGEKKELLRLIF